MTLNDYIDTNFPQIKAQLSWSDSIDVVAIVARAAELYGAADESGMTDLVKAHALTDVAVWRRALADISLDYSFAADGASYSRSQAVESVRANLNTAEVVAMPYLSAYQIKAHPDQANADWFE